VALWLVIDPCVNFGRVYCDFLVYIFDSSIFLRHQTMDKVQKYNSFNAYRILVVKTLGKQNEMDLRLLGCEVDETGSGSCPVADSGVEPSNRYTRHHDYADELPNLLQSVRPQRKSA
jgi:hypothetical protein